MNHKAIAKYVESESKTLMNKNDFTGMFRLGMSYGIYTYLTQITNTIDCIINSSQDKEFISMYSNIANSDNDIMDIFNGKMN